MTLIPINISTSVSQKLPPQLAKIGHDELVLIELQGALEVECNAPSDRDGQMVGRLRVDDASGKPTLFIGHHLLEGKVVNLPKPLAVLNRSTSPAHGHDREDKSQIGWDMVAIVKRKIVFSKRPMPIVGLGTSAATAVGVRKAS